MSGPPSGTVTFLFTDIEGSTPLWDRQPQTMETAIAVHDALMRSAIEQHDGFVFKTVGDAFCAAFSRVDAALAAAIDAQQALLAQQWATPTPLRVRMAIHTGTAEARDGDYLGPPLNRVARILGFGHGAQLLVSQASARLLQERLPGDVTLRDLGEHSLRGMSAPEQVFQVLHPALQQDFPPLNTHGGATARPLPLYPTSFVGRGALLLQVTEFFRHGHVRLLTLTGPGGAGKTRLAVEAATELQGDYPGGAFFVPLAGIMEHALVPGAIAQVLGVRESGGGRGLIERLTAYLQEHRPLLVLDNFEHLTEAAGDVGELLQVPGAAILVTSRTPLHLYGEQEVPVPPLALPAEVPGDDLDEIRETEAVALFLARARAAQPSFVLTSANARAVTTICQMLDGLPLAIELAAPRIKVLAPDALLNRLDHRLAVLTGGARDADERQRTLRATIDWSHDLLGERERTLFRRLAVFRGGFTVDAIEAVCSDGGCPRDEILDVVASLSDKSLLHRQEVDPAMARLVMLETIRDYALERLEGTGEEVETRARHAEHYADLAADLSPGLRNVAQTESLRRLELENDNIRAALDWLATHGGGVGLARAAIALWPFWQVHGDNAEGRAWLARALEEVGPDAPPATRAELLHGMGFLSWSQGEDSAARRELSEAVRLFSEAGNRQGLGRAQVHLGIALWMAGLAVAEYEPQMEEAVAILRECDDLWTLADGLHYRGHMFMERGDLAGARSIWEESAALYRRLGDRWGLALPIKDLGLVSARHGDLVMARRLYEESLAMLRETREKWHIADTLNRLGELAVFDHQYAEALERFDEALRLAREMDNRSGVVETLNRMAEVHLLDRDLDRARTLYEQCLELSSRIGNQRLVAAMRHNLGNLALQEGKPRSAAALFRDGLRIYSELSRDAGIAMALDGLALATASLGDLEAAVMTFGLAAATRERSGLFSEPFDRIEHEVRSPDAVVRLRAQMGDEAFEKAFAAGRTMDVARLLGGGTATDSGARSIDRSGS